jgi:hypothetical protein
MSSGATFNITYTSPIGWDFTPDQIFEGPLGAAVLFIGHPSYPDLQFLAVAGFKKSTELEADYFNFTQNYGAVNRAFTYSINLAPLIYFSADTMINNIHYVISKIKDVEKNEIEVMYTCSNSYYTLQFNYITTVTDFDLNELTYLQNWNNLSIISTLTLEKKFSVTTLKKPGFLNKNILGKLIDEKGKPKYLIHLKK